MATTTCTVDHCDLGDRRQLTPTNGLFSQGSTGTTAQNNSSNTVSNCNIFNFYSNSFDETGIWLDAGNTNWTITGNSSYQTTSRAVTYPNVRAIYINNTSGNNFTITGNFIGGQVLQTPGGRRGPRPAGGSAGSISLASGSMLALPPPSSVQRTPSPTSLWVSTGTDTVDQSRPVWNGIYVQAASANIGTVTGNTVGSGTGTGAISITTSGGDGTEFRHRIREQRHARHRKQHHRLHHGERFTAFTTTHSSLFGIQVNAGTASQQQHSWAAPPRPIASTRPRVIHLKQLHKASRSPAFYTSISEHQCEHHRQHGGRLNNDYVGTANPADRFAASLPLTGVNTVRGNTVRNLSTTSAECGNRPIHLGCWGSFTSGIAAGKTVSPKHRAFPCQHRRLGEGFRQSGLVAACPAAVTVARPLAAPGISSRGITLQHCGLLQQYVVSAAVGCNSTAGAFNRAEQHGEGGARCRAA